MTGVQTCALPIYHHLPDDETAYHAGDGMEKNGGNMNGIGIEMCVNLSLIHI